jgi:hypothetical protein
MWRCGAQHFYKLVIYKLKLLVLVWFSSIIQIAKYSFKCDEMLLKPTLEIGILKLGVLDKMSEVDFAEMCCNKISFQVE